MRHWHCAGGEMREEEYTPQTNTVFASSLRKPNRGHIYKEKSSLISGLAREKCLSCCDTKTALLPYWHDTRPKHVIYDVLPVLAGSLWIPSTTSPVTPALPINEMTRRCVAPTTLIPSTLCISSPRWSWPLRSAGPPRTIVPMETWMEKIALTT